MSLIASWRSVSSLYLNIPTARVCRSVVPVPHTERVVPCLELERADAMGSRRCTDSRLAGARQTHGTVKCGQTDRRRTRRRRTVAPPTSRRCRCRGSRRTPSSAAVGRAVRARATSRATASGASRTSTARTLYRRRAAGRRTSLSRGRRATVRSCAWRAAWRRTTSSCSPRPTGTTERSCSTGCSTHASWATTTR